MTTKMTTKMTKDEIFAECDAKIEKAGNEYMAYPCKMAAETFNARLDAALRNRDEQLIANGYWLPTL